MLKHGNNFSHTNLTRQAAVHPEPVFRHVDMVNSTFSLVKTQHQNGDEKQFKYFK